MATGLMSGKRGLVMGVANDKSIAWCGTGADHFTHRSARWRIQM